MDREVLERGIVRRLLDHVANGTTDMADEVLEIPAALYTSAEHGAREHAALFEHQPLVLCLSGALPAPGTYRAIDLLSTPILLTRDAEGRVRSMANVCRHRGVRVADGAGSARRFTCPFHAWVYDLDGRLVGVPVPEGFEGLCREEKGLVELPVAERHGIIFGSLRPGPPPDIDGFLGPALSAELAMFGLAQWKVWSDPHVHRVNSNWKVSLDTFRENYHFNYLHRRTLADFAYGGVLTFDAFGPHLRNCSAIRTIDSLRDVPEDAWVRPFEHFSYQYALFPNTNLTITEKRLELWQILPETPSTSVVLHTAYVPGELDDAERPAVEEMIRWTCETVVDGEDFWVAGRTEPGIRTGLLDAVVFGRNEPAPQHLHRGFLAALGLDNHVGRR
jgi:phenylpropionate dioxygenase-like ring-hydroxylating dioxygenase large terminal subunit